MKESEERSSNIDEQKARIRQRYKGIDPEELEVIPALPPEDIFKNRKKTTSSCICKGIYG